jgi:hypothetical protein
MRAAATEESTPPLIAASTLTADRRSLNRPAPPAEPADPTLATGGGLPFGSLDGLRPPFLDAAGKTLLELDLGKTPTAAAASFATAPRRRPTSPA